MRYSRSSLDRMPENKMTILYHPCEMLCSSKLKMFVFTFGRPIEPMLHKWYSKAQALSNVKDGAYKRYLTANQKE